jgi:hypothetical protein
VCLCMKKEELVESLGSNTKEEDFADEGGGNAP